MTKDLTYILNLPYFWSSTETWKFLTDTSNDLTTSNIMARLDEFHSRIIGIGHWKHSLGSDYNELSMGRRGKAPAGTPSDLVRFIRNVDQHAPEKMANRPQGLLCQLYRSDYENKHNFVCYWKKKFPNLIPCLWGLRNENQPERYFFEDGMVADQVLVDIYHALDVERDRGLLKARYACQSSRKQFLLEVLQLRKVTYEKYLGMVVTTANALVVTRCDETTQYHTNAKGHLTLLIGLDTLHNDNIQDNDRVVLLLHDIDLQKVTNVLGRFAKFNQEKVTFREIGTHVRKRILKRGKIEIQSCTYPLDWIIMLTGEHACDALDGQQLNLLLRNKKLKLFGQSDLGSAEEYYVSRCLEIGQVEASFFRDDSVYMILNVHKPLEIELVQKLVERKVQFTLYPFDTKVLSNVRLTPWLHETYDNAITRLKVLCNKAHAYLLTYEDDHLNRLITCDDNFLKHLDGLNILSGSPGDGKTTFLKHLYLRSNLKHNITVFTSAKDFVKLFLECDITPESLKQAVVGLISLNEFEGRLACDLLVKGFKATCLIDALDEVDRKHDTLIDRILKCCRQTTNLRFVVSLRSYLHSRYDLDNARLCKLQCLTEVDKVLLIYNYWMPALTVKAEDNDISNMIRLRAWQVVHASRALQFTPLVCRMLAKVYETVVQNSQALQTPQNLNLTTYKTDEIYMKIVDMNFKTYLVEKLNVTESNLDSDFYKVAKESYINAHISLGFKELYPSFLDKFSIHSDIRLTPSQGLLDSTNPVRFSHRTYADYFVDLWCFNVLTGEVTETNLAEFSSFVSTRYFRDGSSEFLNDMLCPHRNIIFPFDLKHLNLVHIRARMGSKSHANIFRILVNSICTHSSEDFIQALRGDEILHYCYVFNSFMNGMILPFQKYLENNLVDKYLSNFNLLRLVTQYSMDKDETAIHEKKLIISELLNKFPQLIDENVRDEIDESVCAFELIDHISEIFRRKYKQQ